jgi:hypothetical protein
MLAQFLACSGDADWRAGDRRAVEGGMEEKWKWKRKNRGNREGEGEAWCCAVSLAWLSLA